MMRFCTIAACAFGTRRQGRNDPERYMKFHVRPSPLMFLFLAFIAATNVLSAHAAEEYPNRPVRLVVPFAPSGSTDVLARVVAERLAILLKQPVVVDNRAGAGSLIGTQLVVQARPDGYTLLINGSSLFVLPAIKKDLPFDVKKDLAPIFNAVTLPILMFANASTRFETVQGLIAHAKANPGKLRYADTGVGQSVHLIGELFGALAGINVSHVSYKGAGPATLSVLGGETEFGYAGPSPALDNMAKSGKLRILAVMSKERSALVPGVPAAGEIVPAFDARNTLGFLAPAGTPRDIIERLNRHISAILRDPDMPEVLARIGMEAQRPHTPAAFAADITSAIASWTKAIQIAKIEVE